MKIIAIFVKPGFEQKECGEIAVKMLANTQYMLMLSHLQLSQVFASF